MLEGFKPLDLSFLQNRPLDYKSLAGVPSGVPDLKTIAQTISAGTDWQHIQQNLDNEKNASPQKPTFWGGLMDLLSSGNYAVANGIEGATQGHGFLDSALKAGQGALEGLGAGVTSGLAGMTGLSDDVARDNFGKTRFSDLIQNHTPLGIKIDPATGKLTQGGQEVTPSQAKGLMWSNALFGLAGDIFLDPLTYTGFGLPSKLVEGVEAPLKVASDLDKLKGLTKGIPDITAVNKGLPQLPEYVDALHGGSITPVANVLNQATGTIPAMEKGIKAIPEIPQVAKDVAPVAEAVEPLHEPVVQAIRQGSIAHPEIQSKLASKIGGLIQAGPDTKTVVSNVLNWLNTKHSGFDFPNVENYLEKIRTASEPDKFFQLMKYQGNDAKIAPLAANLRKRVIDGVRQAIQADVEASKLTGKTVPITSAKDLIEGVSKGIKDTSTPVAASRNFGKAENAIFDTVVNKYKNDIATGMFRTARDPEAVAKAIESGKNVKWSGPKQVNVWNTFLHQLVGTGNLKYATDSRYVKALNMLRAFEDHYMSLGHVPYSASKTAESVPLRLSDVIAKLNPRDFANHGDIATTILRSAFSGGEIPQASQKIIRENPELASRIMNAVQEAKATSHIAESSAVQQGMEAGKSAADSIMQNALSDAKRNEAALKAASIAKEIAQKSGASLPAARVAQTWVKDGFYLHDPVGSAISSSKMKTLQALSGSKDVIPPSLSNVTRVTKALEKQLGPISSVAGKVGPKAKVEEWLGARFNAAYRNPEMRPIYLSHMASAKATVGLRAQQVNALVHKFGKDGDLWNEAWDVARGLKAPGTQESLDLSREIQKVMEDLFGGSGLRKGAELEDSVMGRAQILRQEVNDILKRFGIKNLFTNKGIYSQGVDWLKSWESWKTENPLQLIYNVQNAVEMAVRSRIMHDELISRFGTYKDLPGFTTKLDKATLKEFPQYRFVKFSPAHAEQAQYFLKALSEVNKPSNRLLQKMDNVMSKWKSSVTVYRPAHYIRNLMGDLTFNWLAGVNDTKPYSIAMKIMKSQKGRYEWETGNLADLTSPEALKKAMMRGPATGPIGSNIALTLRNGQHVTNDMAYIAAFKEGLLPNVRVLEDLPEGVPTLLDRVHLPGKLEGKGQEFVHNIHEQRDHFVRLAHFVDALKKSNKPFEAAVKDAASEVRKWHPDGMDLTSFERNGMRRAFPFYSWSRKAIPLVIESVVTSPGKTMLYPKLQYGMQQLFMGGQGGGSSFSDPFPDAQLWPDWMREKGIGPLWGSPGNYTFINPSNPMQDLAAQFGDIPQMLGSGFSAKGIGGVSSMVNPLLKIPAEVMTGTNIQSQAPITDWTQYFTGQIPGVSDLSRATNVDFGGTSPKFSDQGFGNIQNIINYLTAAGYTQTTPKTAITGQYDLRDYLKRLKNQ